ncbi:MAG: phosphotransacetylase family protein [Candidatus Bathyarchaeota archaeon]
MVEKQSIYICSTSSFCGKSVISLGLALNLQDAGFKVGYFKPIGSEMGRDSKGVKIDEDARLMASILGLKMPMDTIVPLIFGTRYLEETENVDPHFFDEKIMKAYKKVAEEKDAVILEGTHSLGIGNLLGIDAVSLSKKLKTRILMISTYQNDNNIDSDTWTKRIIDATGGDFAGLILNRVPRTDLERVRRFAPHLFQKHGIELLGIIPEDIELMAPTVKEICDKINCEVLTAKNNLDNLVEDILVGAMSPEMCLTYFRRSFRKAVITGGDRTDVQQAALETNLSALILTGNIYPDARVLSRAEELKVPVLLVPADTYSTVKNLQLTGRVSSTDKKKIALAKKLVMGNVEWKKIFKLPDSEGECAREKD